MIKLLIKRFVPDFSQVTKKEVREHYGVLAGVLGIICNIFLFSVKLVIGFLMNSIAIISDAFNNLSDMGSSVVTIIGLKMSNLHADKEHPFGHGRIEYISSLIVSFIIMLVGFELLKSSVNKIINPEKPELSLILIIILCLSVLVKIWMFSYNRYIGKQINSGVIKASATDSLNDAISTGAVIVSAIMDGELAWAISDTFNGLMALPNLIGLVFMSGLLVKITKNYFDRKKGVEVEPMLSAYPQQNEEFKAEL